MSMRRKASVYLLIISVGLLLCSSVNSTSIAKWKEKITSALFPSIYAQSLIKVYVSNSGGSNVSVFNARTNILLNTIPVPSGAYDIAITPDGSRAYVSSASDQISIIDTGTDAVTSTIQIPGVNTYGIVINSTGTRAYVATIDQTSNEGKLAVIDITNNTLVTSVVRGPGPAAPSYLKISSNNQRVYVPNSWDGTVSVIDTSNNSLITNIQVGAPAGSTTGPGVAINTTGSRLYVSNEYGNNIYVVDMSNNSVIGNTVVGRGSENMMISPDGSQLYVPNINSNTVSVVSTTSNIVVATIPIVSGSSTVAMLPSGTRAFIASSGANTVTVVDPRTNQVIGIIGVGIDPKGIAIKP